MHDRLLRFPNVSKILSDNQCGFRKHHSNAFALACLYDKISSAIKIRNVALVFYRIISSL